jgi:hypothetical protein
MMRYALRVPGAGRKAQSTSRIDIKKAPFPGPFLFCITTHHPGREAAFFTVYRARKLVQLRPSTLLTGQPGLHR